MTVTIVWVLLGIFHMPTILKDYETAQAVGVYRTQAGCEKALAFFKGKLESMPGLYCQDQRLDP